LRLPAREDANAQLVDVHLDRSISESMAIVALGSSKSWRVDCSALFVISSTQSSYEQDCVAKLQFCSYHDPCRSRVHQPNRPVM
jgi:hypothetical protein